MKINFILNFSEEIVHGLQFLLFYSDGLKLSRLIFQIFKKNWKSDIFRFYERKTEVILTIFRLW